MSESEASVSDATVNNALKKKLGNSSTGRKPLSYLFDSDSSADEVALAGKAGTTTKDNKKQTKGKSPNNPRGRGQKATKKSSTSDSDDLELPVQKVVGNNNLSKSEGPIYSDSDSDGSLKKRPGSPVATKAAVKEFTRKSNKKELGAKSSLAQQKKTVTPKQGKQGPKGGRKKKGAEQQLIVPQREAAKKATESIRTVKSRKDGLVGDNASGQDGSVASPATFNDRESESFEKTAMEKFKDIAAASVQDKIKKRNDKSKPTVAENRRGANKKSVKSESVGGNKDAESTIHGHYDELRDQYEFDGSNDSKNVPNFVPQRQAAKKAAEHIRSGLSNIVAARLIIEDEMEATRRKGKGDRTTQPNKTSLDSSSPGPPPTGTTGGKKQPNRSRGKSPFIDKAVENSSLQTGDSSSSKQRSRKRVLSKGITTNFYQNITYINCDLGIIIFMIPVDM